MSLSLNFVVNPSALNLDEEYGSFIKSFLSLSLVHGKNRSNLKKFFNELIDEASNLLKSEGVSNKKMLFYRTADMRYIGQEYYVNISIDSSLNLNKINLDFHNTYKKTFGHSTPDAPVEIINLRLVAIGLVDRVIDYSKINNQKTTKRVNIKKREVIFNNVKHLTNIINRNSIKLKELN